MPRHIYLSGFMGTGKTTIGKLLAARLNRPFLDTDHLIESKLKLSVQQIFTKHGEDFFRHEEYLALQSLNGLRPHVISLGGGIVLRYANRLILQQGVWINLNSSPARILQRTANSRRRPLLKSANKRETIEALLKARAPYYALAPHQIDTEWLHPGAVVDRIVKFAR